MLVAVTTTPNENVGLAVRETAAAQLSMQIPLRLDGAGPSINLEIQELGTLDGWQSIYH